MAVNSGQIDLNSDAVLFDRENEVVGFNSSGSSVSVGVFHSETLRNEPVGGEVLDHDKKVFHAGDDRGGNGSLELLSEPVVVGIHMNDPGCDVMINGSGKEGFGEETELEVVDGGYDKGLVGMYRESVFSEVSLCVSDLVWGKVRGHPWWPGQIFDPSAASEMAKRHLKEDCYLIVYFGDKTFSWNDVSMIKPFQPYFSQMEKQSDLEEFQHAVDSALYEVSRRVEFGLSCPCMPEQVFSELKTQAISNAGIRQHTCTRNGNGNGNATSLEPMKLVNYVKSLALSPHMEYDKLDFVIARAQLLCSKGYSQSQPLFENDVDIQLMREREQIDEQELKTHLGFSHKRKHHVPKDSKQPCKKLKLLSDSDLMSDKRFSIPNGEHASESKSGDESISRCSSRKRKEAYDDSASMEHGMSLEQMHDGETRVTATETVASMTSAMEPCYDSYWTDRIFLTFPEEQSLSKTPNHKRKRRRKCNNK